MSLGATGTEALRVPSRLLHPAQFRPLRMAKCIWKTCPTYPLVNARPVHPNLPPMKSRRSDTSQTASKGYITTYRQSACRICRILPLTHRSRSLLDRGKIALKECPILPRSRIVGCGVTAAAGGYHRRYTRLQHLTASPECGIGGYGPGEWMWSAFLDALSAGDRVAGDRVAEPRPAR